MWTAILFCWLVITSAAYDAAGVRCAGYDRWITPNHNRLHETGAK